MSDKKPTEKGDVTKAWAATQDQKGASRRLRIFALLSWAVAIGGEIAGIYMLVKLRMFDAASGGNLPLLIGLLVGIAVFAIAGSMLWKAANRHSPATIAFNYSSFGQLAHVVVAAFDQHIWFQCADQLKWRVFIKPCD